MYILLKRHPQNTHSITKVPRTFNISAYRICEKVARLVACHALHHRTHTHTDTVKTQNRQLDASEQAAIHPTTTISSRYHGMTQDTQDIEQHTTGTGL